MIVSPHYYAVALVLLGYSSATINDLLDTSYRVCGRKIGFPSQDTRTILKNAGTFVPRNIIFSRFQMSGQNIYITQPRYKSGVPSTLSSLFLSGNDYDLTANAYPNWSSQEEGNCEAIQSAIDVFLDNNGILWVLDGGLRLNLETPDTKCPAKIVAISTRTNRITKTISLSSLTSNTSNVQFLVVENHPSGDDYIYVSDAGSKSLYVLNSRIGAEKGTSIPLPNSVNSACNSTNILYLTLIKRNNINYVFFNYANCDRIFSIATENLIAGESEPPIYAAGKVQSPILIVGTDGGSKLYFRLANGSPDIYMWDTINYPLAPEGWTKVWLGEPDRVATHVTKGLQDVLWILESNFESYRANSSGCLGDCSKISPLVNVLN